MGAIEVWHLFIKLRLRKYLGFVRCLLILMHSFFQKDIPWTTVPQDVNRWYLKTGFCVQIVWDLCGEMKLLMFLHCRTFQWF